MSSMVPSNEYSTPEMIHADVGFVENVKTIKPSTLPPLLQDLLEDDIRALEKRMLRKVDWRMLPLVILMYILVSASKSKQLPLG